MELIFSIYKDIKMNNAKIYFLNIICNGFRAKYFKTLPF